MNFEAETSVVVDHQMDVHKRYRELQPDFAIIPLREQIQYRCPNCGAYRPVEYFNPLGCPMCGTIIECRMDN